MRIKRLFSIALIFGILVNSVFAETVNSDFPKPGDRFAQSKDNALGLRSTSVDVIYNTRNLIKSAGRSSAGSSKSRRTLISPPTSHKRKRRPKRPRRHKNKEKATEPRKTVNQKSKQNRSKRASNVSRRSKLRLSKNRKQNSKSISRRQSKKYKCVRNNKRNFKRTQRFRNKKSRSKRIQKSRRIRKSKRFRNRRVRVSNIDTRYYNLIYRAKNLEHLTPRQKARIYRLHKRILKSLDVQIVLQVIKKGEGGGLLIIVGKGYGKSGRFKRIQRRLTTRTHPAYQFPSGMRCFYYNRNVRKCSTAAGLYQITKTNYDKMAKHLGINDFTKESQQIMALELMRTGRAKFVRGNYKGRGYVELLKGNVDGAIRYGTNDWASSKFSEWRGRKTDYIGDARKIAKKIKKQRKLKDTAYFQGWVDEVEAENGKENES